MRLFEVGADFLGVLPASKGGVYPLSSAKQQLGTLFCTAAHAQVLSVPLAVQEQSNWCWAASTSAYLGAYGYSAPQCRVANAAYRDAGISSKHETPGTEES